LSLNCGQFAGLPARAGRLPNITLTNFVRLSIRCATTPKSFALSRQRGPGGQGREGFTVEPYVVLVWWGGRALGHPEFARAFRCKCEANEYASKLMEQNPDCWANVFVVCG